MDWPHGEADVQAQTTTTSNSEANALTKATLPRSLGEQLVMNSTQRLGWRLRMGYKAAAAARPPTSTLTNFSTSQPHHQQQHHRQLGAGSGWGWSPPRKDEPAPGSSPPGLLRGMVC